MPVSRSCQRCRALGWRNDNGKLDTSFAASIVKGVKSAAAIVPRPATDHVVSPVHRLPLMACATGSARPRPDDTPADGAAYQRRYEYGQFGLGDKLFAV